MESSDNNLPGKTLQDFLMNDAAQDEIHQRYVGIFGYTLAMALRTKIEMTVRSNEVVLFETLKTQLPGFSSWTLFQIKPTALHGLLIMEPEYVFPLVDMFYGGDAASAVPEKPRRFSEIELRLIKRVAVSMLEDLQRAWEPTFPAELAYGTQKSEPTDITDYFTADDSFRRVNFEFRYHGARSMTAGLCYPLQSKNLGRFLTHEHSQTAALTLSHLSSSEEAVSALQAFDTERQADMFHRIATMSEIPPGVTSEITEVASKALFEKREIPPGSHPGSLEKAVELLKLFDRKIQEGIFQEWSKMKNVSADFIETMKKQLS